ncbi:MAG: hypothetical protein KJ728_09995 [Alphaproteobacteria bacterium]|jgi:hypothetical protein|uniref:Spore coat protein U domain-containing protein n=1 Tax=Brevundimonas mediterranea TaxID=74329 RepID=A0AB37EAY2_9CAUL|nr:MULTISPECIES: hypothetical protein [Brevundimonas]MBU1271458.1 hypothetical protein [Alphaproteobacteria bacterium]OGN47719.1 MAG: hypothetical protein A2795_11345 [Caulobacterales bacterium RIFCSPHIGHO2_01_FULL_67_30]OGN65527.1 MAG: hypothetical protein A3K57_01420 [Caulobacterales bacterium RIFOXYA1_FULL_67_7]OYX80316.1 MAG: hypothetical protein B7Y85_05845 [Brevundimonas sp. 32-68-21]EDX81462.1 hypothetical protein BBAL3_2619 [Brevundimonas sp. BAL3]
MKRIVFAASAAALALTAAGAASAQDSQSVAINASVAAKCGVSAQATTVTLAGDLTDSEAKVRSGVTTEIADALNGARIIAFCNGVNNSVTVDRAVLARTGATGNGLTEGGFAQFIRYNLDTTINGLALDTTSTAGASNVAQRFGGHVSLSDSNTHVRFAQAASNGGAVATSGGSSDIATNWGSNTDRRLAAGAYTGSVNVTVAPGA